MTEKDLYRFRNAVRALKSAKDVLREYDEIMCSPRSPRISPLPQDHGGGTDKTAVALDRRSRLVNNVEAAEREYYSASEQLGFVEQKLNKPEEKQVLDILYRKGLKVPEASKAIHMCIRNIYYYRASILDQIKDI